MTDRTDKWDAFLSEVETALIEQYGETIGGSQVYRIVTHFDAGQTITETIDDVAFNIDLDLDAAKGMPKRPKKNRS